MPDATSLPLDPSVTGRLASAERNVIEAIKAGAPFRTTVSLEAPIALAAIRAAAAEKRDFSNFCEVALLEYTKQTAAPTPELQEFIGKLQAAYAASPRILAALEKAIRSNLRKKEAA